MLVLTWNLYHGRHHLNGVRPPLSSGDHLDEFAAALAGWEWDVALLQEVPPWWPPALAEAAGAEARTALTSRNLGLWLRRPLAQRWPDLIKSNGGGANAILVRCGGIGEHRTRRLRRWPERRVVHAVALADGTWVGNVHAQVHSEARAQADVGVSCETVRAWSRGAPFVLGGDLNVRAPVAPGMTHAGGHGVDHMLASGLVATGEPVLPDRGPLSDHAPVIVALGEGSVEAVRR